MLPLTELGLATGFEHWSPLTPARPPQGGAAQAGFADANPAKARPAERAADAHVGRPAGFEPANPARATGLPGGPLGSPGPDYTPGPITTPVTDVPGTGPTGPGIDRPTLPPDPPEFPGTPTPPEVPGIQTPGTPVTDVPGTGPESRA